MAAKAVRRVHLNQYLTFLFENHETVRYQIQEIMRAERIVRDADIQHEIDTYNSMLGAPGELGCVLLIEIENEADRSRLLTQWVGLQEHLYATLASGTRVHARFDAGQVGSDRLSAVQYLRFPVGGETPVAIGTDFEGLESEVDLTAEQIAALTEDLRRA